MGRRLHSLGWVVSLVMSLAVMGAWVHSGLRYVYAWRLAPCRVGWTLWEAGSARGRIYVKRVAPVLTSGVERWGVGGGPGAGPADWPWMPDRSPKAAGLSLVGFHWCHVVRVGSSGRDYVEAVVPDYFLLLVFLSSAWWCGVKRRVSVRGFCRECGYDLRATPERCPECGTVNAGCGEAIGGDGE